MARVSIALFLIAAACAGSPPVRRTTPTAATAGDSVATPAPAVAPSRAPEAKIGGSGAIACVPKGREGSGAHFCEFRDAHVFADGSYVAGGGLWGEVELAGKPLRATSRQSALLVWVNASGAVTRTVTLGKTWKNVIHHVDAADNGTLFVAGFASTGFHPQFPATRKKYDDERPFVAALKADGKPTFVHDFTEPVIDIAATADGFVAVGDHGLVRSYGPDGKLKREWRMKLTGDEFLVTAVIGSGTDVWTISYRSVNAADSPTKRGGFQLAAAHHVADVEPRVFPLAPPDSRGWNQAYAGAVEGGIVVAGLVDHEPGGRVMLWRIGEDGITWTASEPIETRPGAIAEVRLRGAAVTGDGMTTIITYILAGRTASAVRVLHHASADGRLQWDGRPADADLEQRVAPLIYGGEHQFVVPTARGVMLSDGHAARGIDPIAQLEQLERL